MIYTQDSGLNTFYTGRHLLNAASEYYQEQQQYEESNIIDRASTLGVIQSSRYALNRLWGRPTGKFLSRETFIPKSLSSASILKGTTSLPGRLALGYMLFGYDNTSDIVANAALVGGMNWAGRKIGNTLQNFQKASRYNEFLEQKNPRLALWKEAHDEAKYIGKTTGQNKIVHSLRKSIYKDKLAENGLSAKYISPGKGSSMLHNFIYRSEMMKGKFGIAVRDIIDSYKPVHLAEAEVATRHIYKKSFKNPKMTRRVSNRGKLYYKGEWATISSISKNTKNPSVPVYEIKETMVTIGGPLDGKVRRTASRAVTGFTANSKWKQKYIEERLADAVGAREREIVIERAARSSDAALLLKFGTRKGLSITGRALNVLGKIAGSTAIIAGVGTYLATPYVKKGFDSFDKGLTRLQNSFSLDFGDGYSPLSGEANNERTRALDRMKNANLNARTSMGSEASFYAG